jgi:hypothetical protein
LWFLFVLFIPLVGVLVYLIARVTACASGWWGISGSKPYRRIPLRAAGAQKLLHPR